MSAGKWAYLNIKYHKLFNERRDAKGMAKDVNETLIQLIIQHHQPKIANASEAMRLIGQWTADKRYVRDIWQ
jgi:hypothetical protein